MIKKLSILCLSMVLNVSVLNACEGKNPEFDRQSNLVDCSENRSGHESEEMVSAILLQQVREQAEKQKIEYEKVIKRLRLISFVKTLGITCLGVTCGIILLEGR